VNGGVLSVSGSPAITVTNNVLFAGTLTLGTSSLTVSKALSVASTGTYHAGSGATSVNDDLSSAGTFA
jgi:hypothetical protein